MNHRIRSFKITNTRLNIILSMLFPFFLSLISLILISTYNFQHNKEQAQSSCLTSMSLFSQRCENEIMNVIHSSDFLSENSYFLSAVNNTANLNDTTTLFNIKNSMLNFKTAHPVVNDIIIINQASQQIISSDNVYSFNNYFEKVFSYKNYAKEYWQNYKSFNSEQYRILSPSAITCDNKTTAVIPIVIRGNGNMNFKNLLVINISITELIAFQNSYLTTEDSKIFLMNNYTGDIFYNAESMTVTENILNTVLYQNLLNKSSFKHSFKDLDACLVTTYSTSNNLSGYTYFAAIPYKNITKIQISGVLFSILIFLIFGAATILFSIVNTNRILTPIRNAIVTIDPQRSHSDNIFENLELAAANIRKVNSDLFTALPFAQEKYLINFLNSADYSITEETKEIIRSTLPFENEYFASVILQTYPTKLFFETYNQTEYSNIQSGLHTVIKQMFSEKFLSFFLTSDKDVLYIILNTKDDTQIDRIKEIISEISGLLEQDNGYLNIYVGLGGIYKDWEGLKKAHLEAMSNLKFVHRPSPKIVIQKNEYLNDAKISQLYNALISSDTEYAHKLIDEYCQDAEQDQRHLKQLYTQILTTIFKAMRTRNISYNDNQLDFEMYSNILTKSCSEIYKEIVLLLNVIKDAKESEEPVNLGVEIIDYINTNFTFENLSLDMLAEQFKVQPTYISTLVKNTLGVGFHKHLTDLRVSKAKELLAHTDMNIQEIYENCGFCSKPTFFRVFKQDTGVTPSEYRKTQNNTL